MTLGLSSLQGPVSVLFTDLDGTLTTTGHLTSEVISSLYQLWNAQMQVVLVTGRPAGWGHALASLFPFAAVVTENGGVSFVPSETGFEKLYGVARGELLAWREKMNTAVTRIVRKVPEARLSTDSLYREVDLAIDWNEEIHLPVEVADEIVLQLQEEGFTASRSSVHINFAPPGFNKYTAVTQISKQVFQEQEGETDTFVYVGDSLNDAPMFESFVKTVGVANVRERWDELPHKPRYITQAVEGPGFVELVDRLLSLE